MASLKELRESKGLTQEQVASLIGVSRQTYSSYESSIGRVRMWRAQQIADALGVGLSEIVDASMSQADREAADVVEDVKLVLLDRGYDEEDAREVCRALRPVIAEVASRRGGSVEVPVKGVADCTW